ncbi:MAG: general secretion pathway protein I [Bacteroidia bacterium]|jgi:general secretion pathway protein I
MSPPRTEPGFSLIEVVVALALFAMASVVLTSSFVNALLAREHGQSNDLRHADIRAVRMQLLLEPNMDDAEDGDRYDTLNNGTANWEASIEPTNVIDLFEVQLSIEFSEPQEEQAATYTESLYLLRPTWSKPDERSSLLQDKKDELQNARDFDRF